MTSARIEEIRSNIAVNYIHEHSGGNSFRMDLALSDIRELVAAYDVQAEALKIAEEALEGYASADDDPDGAPITQAAKDALARIRAIRGEK